MQLLDARLVRRLARLDGSFRFGFVDEVSPDALAQFYERMFPDRAPFLIRHWRWLYQAGNDGSLPSPLLAIAGDRVVGHGGLIRAVVERGAERREAVWMTDYAVLPEFQRGIIGGALVKMGHTVCPFRMAFLSERSWALASKLGWQTHFQTTAFQLPLRPERLARLQTIASTTPGLGAVARLAGVPVRAASRAFALAATDLEVVPATAETLKPFMQAPQTERLSGPRSADFMHWRVLSHPHAGSYVVLKSASAQALARVITWAGCRRLHLLTVHAQPDDRRGLSRLFRDVVRHALAADVDTILFVTSVRAVASVAARWLPLRARQRFAYHADDEAGRAFLGNGDHVWELIDSDFELMCESEG